MTEINLRQLEIFVAVVDHGSFTEAANRLYLAQSTVSSHIRALEEALHVVLFRRKSKRNMVLTPDGKRVYQYARDILTKCAALRSDVMGDPRRDLAIGASTVPAQSLLPGYLAEFSAAWPDCCCTLRCGDSGQIHQLLLDGDIHLGFVGSSDDRQNLSYEPVAQDRLVMITPNTPELFALRQKGVLGRELLTHYPLIFREHGSGTQKVIDNYISRLRPDAHSLRVTAYVSDPAVLQQLVARASRFCRCWRCAPRCRPASYCSLSWTSSRWSAASIWPGAKRAPPASWPGPLPPSSAGRRNSIYPNPFFD